MKLTIVGCAPAWTRRAGRASSCYLVEHDGRAIVFDLGQGAFAELGLYRPPHSVNAVLVSHLHPDHYIDLVPLRHYLKYEIGDFGRFEVHGPAQLTDRLDHLFAEDGFLDGMAFSALAPGRFICGGFYIEAARVTHIPDSFAFRVAAGDGPGLVYSGDCGVADDLLPLVRTGDVLLCEAASGADPEQSGIHLDAASAASVAACGQVSRLIMTHVLDGAEAEAAKEAARRVYDGEVSVAEPGLTLTIG